MKIKAKKKQKPEKQIQNEILEWLEKKGFFCWRNNNIGLFDVYTGKFRRKGKYQVLGVSDILGLMKDGRLIAIEVKSRIGRITENQQNFLDKVNENGGVGFLARSIEDVEKNLFLL